MPMVSRMRRATRDFFWRDRIFFFAIATALLFSASRLEAQWSGRDGWVEEPDTKVEGATGHSYLDPASIHRGEDGLIYFNESIDVVRPEQIGKTGFMKD